jgi:hypothetical protein
MRVVSEQSAEEMRWIAAHTALVPRLRDLAANVLRIVKGAGKPLELLRQMESCSAAIREYGAAHGYVPSYAVMHEILNCEAAWHEYRPWIKKGSTAAERDLEETERALAIRRIRDASLQVAASMLVDQMTLHTRAEHDIYEGVRMLEEARASRRGRYQERRSPPASRIKKGTTGKAKPPTKE